MQDFAGKTAVVTGAASGIGQAIATALSDEGMAVVLADIDQDALDSAAAGFEQRDAPVYSVRTDVSDAASVDELAARTAERFGNVHVLVNNAGVVMTGRSWELTLADWNWLHGVCFWGVVHGMRAFLPGMLDHGEPGHVLNVSSMAGLAGQPRCAPYDSAKAGVIALTEDLVFELEELSSALRASVLCPGYTTTNIRNSAARRPERFERIGTAAADVRPGGPSELYRGPEVLAELALDAIRDERVYALDDWQHWSPVVERRFDAILEARNPSVPVYP